MSTPSRDEVTSIVLRNRAFSGLLPGDFTAFLHAGVVRSLAKGDVLYEEGALAEGGFVLLSGRVELRTQPRPGVERASQIYTAGALFGQEGFVKAWPRTETCVAVEDAWILSVSTSAFQKLLEAGDLAAFGVIDALMPHFVQAVRDANQRLQDVHVRPDRTLAALRALVGGEDAP